MKQAWEGRGGQSSPRLTLVFTAPHKTKQGSSLETIKLWHGKGGKLRHLMCGRTMSTCKSLFWSPLPRFQSTRFSPFGLTANEQPRAHQAGSDNSSAVCTPVMDGCLRTQTDCRPDSQGDVYNERMKNRTEAGMYCFSGNTLILLRLRGEAVFPLALEVACGPGLGTWGSAGMQAG